MRHRSEPQTLSLVIRRTIRATAERLFEAWTQPAQIQKWWGPAQVTCPSAEVDLRVGGSYRIANCLPDGQVIQIAGQFEVIEPPRELVYTWGFGPDAGATERVTVRFVPNDGVTEVIIVHERLADAARRDLHEQGWYGCLDGLERYLGT
jgi:uncharacterized protein YndB with AHSA1/START domain